MIYNFLFQKVIFPLSEFISGTSIQQKIKFLNKSQYWSREKIEEYQNNRLKELIKHAYINVPYYKKLFDKLDLKPSDIKTKKDLKKLPFLTKEIIKKNFEDLRASNYKNRSFETHTSGSTGQPTAFYQDNALYSWIWGAHFRAWQWAGYELGDRYAKISLNKDRYKIKKKIQDFLMNTVYIYSEKFDKNSIKKYVGILFEKKPKFVYGFSSQLYLIAEYMEENKLSYPAKAVFTMGDNLMPHFRLTIQKVFLSGVYDEYGCGGEGILVASQCEFHNYHLNEESVIAEKVGNEIVLTGLNNFPMPLIRYKPDDFVTFSNSKCKCGRNLSLMKSIDGRSYGYVLTPKGTKVIVLVFTGIFRYFKGVEQFKIIQEKLDHLTIILKVNSDFDKRRDETGIINKISNATEGLLKITIDYVNNIPFEKNGKYKIIESRLK